jgi:iron(III) transport system substrate-binding protein
MRSREGNRRRLASATACALMAAVVAAGCGSENSGAPASDGGGGSGLDRAKNSEQAKKSMAAIEKYNAMSGQERTDALMAAAEEEGSVSLYTTNSDIDPIIGSFEDKYGIDVESYRATPETMLQRVLQEQTAGFYGADLVEDADAAVVFREGLGATYVNDELTSQMRDFNPDDGMIPTRYGAFVVGWNTDRVKESELPDTLEGFTDPKWKGRLSMEDSDWPWYMVLHQQMTEDGKSDAEIKKTFDTLASYSKVVASHTLQGQLLAAGEFDVALSAFNHTIDTDADEGAPVAWKRQDGSAVEPIVMQQEGVVPVKTAPHPAAALLFIDHMLTEGQKIMADLHRPTSIPTGKDPFEGFEPLFVSNDQYLDEAEKWDKEYTEFIADREVVEAE